MIGKFPDDKYRISLAMEEYERYLDERDRRLYLTSPIDGNDYDYNMSMGTQIVDSIIAFNREDRDILIEERKPIRMYINSPGGDIIDGFAIVGAIKVSKTPIYTINVGQWSSMAFLIGITGHKRFSLPDMTFLMHDGHSYTFGTANKVIDKAEFDKRYEKEVIREHVLKYGKMAAEEYDRRVREEIYMLPKDALEYGFIDEIVKDVDDIL
ncbi:ATP-dependent Clp protease proteolytic subunit [Candidatus Saccharibacteria bacterium]|nr:ATP-dependent Clp protease proteolytic subunit [Candidatus Saccharibacteria bacterium]